MHTLLFILAIHALLLGFGFSFAGWLTLIAASENEEAQIKNSYERARPRGWLGTWLWYGQFRRNFTSVARMTTNWADRPDARKYIYAGLALLALAALLGFPLGAYK